MMINPIKLHIKCRKKSENYCPIKVNMFCIVASHILNLMTEMTQMIERCN